MRVLDVLEGSEIRDGLRWPCFTSHKIRKRPQDVDRQLSFPAVFAAFPTLFDGGCVKVGGGLSSVRHT